MNFLANLLKNSDNGLSDAVDSANEIMSTISGIATGVFGVLVLGMIGVAAYLAYKMFTASDDTKRKNAKGQLIYAIIGVVVLIIMLILVPVIMSFINDAASSMFNLFF